MIKRADFWLNIEQDISASSPLAEETASILVYYNSCEDWR